MKYLGPALTLLVMALAAGVLAEQFRDRLHTAPSAVSADAVLDPPPMPMERPEWERICWDVARHYHEPDGGCRGPGCAESRERTFCEKHGRIR
jgi:hypothetical protein